MEYIALGRTKTDDTINKINTIFKLSIFEYLYYSFMVRKFSLLKRDNVLY